MEFFGPASFKGLEFFDIRNQHNGDYCINEASPTFSSSHNLFFIDELSKGHHCLCLRIPGRRSHGQRNVDDIIRRNFVIISTTSFKISLPGRNLISALSLVRRFNLDASRNVSAIAQRTARHCSEQNRISFSVPCVSTK